MKVAVDLLGGDNAPSVPIAAIVMAIKKKTLLPEQIVAIGPKELFNKIPHHLWSKSRGVVHQECANNTRSSIIVGIQGVNNKDWDAFVSAGDTRLMVGLGVRYLGRLKSKLSPAIAVPMPNVNGPCLLLDAGATVSCKPEDYLHFAEMATVYAEEMFGIYRPKVGLLNIGTEEEKGDKTLQ